MSQDIYIITKNGTVYSVEPTLEKAKAEVARMALAWYEYGGTHVANPEKAEWVISPQRVGSGA